MSLFPHSTQNKIPSKQKTPHAPSFSETYCQIIPGDSAGNIWFITLKREQIQEEESDRHQRTPQIVFSLHLTLQLHQRYQEIQSRTVIIYSIFLPH